MQDFKYVTKIARDNMQEVFMRGIYQHDDNDCGLACVLTVCKWLKIKVDERSLRKNLYLGKDGLSLYGITQILHEKGIKSYALECEADELCQLYYEDKKPCIIMICDDDEFHYVVLGKCDSKKMYIWDPNKGQRVIKREKFEYIWSGYAIKITDISFNRQEPINKKLICFGILKEQKKLMWIVLLFTSLLMVLSIIVTFAYREVIDSIKYSGQNVESIFGFLMVMGAGYVIMMLAMIIKERLIIYANREMEISLNRHFTTALLNMTIQKREDYSSGGILDRYYRLTTIVKTFSSIFSSVIFEILSLIAGVYIMININPVMFAIVNIIVFSYIICFFIAKSKLFILSKTVIDKQSILTTHIEETVQNLISLRAFNADGYKSKIENEISSLKINESKLEYMDSVMGAILQAVENITMLFVMAYGINSISNGTMSLGTLLAFEAFIGFFISPVKNLLGVLPSIQETMLTFNKIEDVLIFSQELRGNGIAYKASREMLLENVDIAYGFDEPVLRNISLKIGERDKVFLMGASGCGKSTLAKTMAGLMMYKRGKILSPKVLYLSQEAEIFSGSIRENILMWEECRDIQLFEDILQNIGIYKLMESRGLTLDSHLQESGMNLSGGERQRIAIARALMFDIPIYIFDEATSHLDMESEKRIIAYIKQILCDKTCIFISHNAQLLEENNKIIFIDQSKKVHYKMHSELLKNSEYRTILNIG